MLILFIALITEAAISYPIHRLFSNPDTLPIIWVVVNTILLPFALTSVTRNRRIFILLLLGYILRLSFMFFDVYLSNVFVLPNSGADATAFSAEALRIYQDPTYIPYAFMGIYTKFIGVVYLLFGPSRIIPQYINVLLGIAIILSLVKILAVLNIRPRIIIPSVVLATIFPQSVVFSAILLRENIVSFGILISLYQFVLWYKHGRILDAFLSVVLLLATSIFHAGVIGLLIGYSLAFAFYRRRTRSLRANLKGILLNGVMILIIILAFVTNKDLFFSKFSSVDEQADVYKVATASRGESAYLTWIDVNSPGQLILFSPVRMLYFMFAPMPWDWRGAIDAASFILDSSVYLFLIVYIIRNFSGLRRHRALVTCLLCGLIGFVFVFAYGTSNAGTAIRHRNKIFGYMVVIYAIIWSERRAIRTESSVWPRSGGGLRRVPDVG